MGGGGSGFSRELRRGLSGGLDLRFMVSSFRARSAWNYGSGLGVWGSGFRVQGSGLEGMDFRESLDEDCWEAWRISDLGFMVLNFRTWGFGWFGEEGAGGGMV